MKYGLVQNLDYLSTYSSDDPDQVERTFNTAIQEMDNEVNI